MSYERLSSIPHSEPRTYYTVDYTHVPYATEGGQAYINEDGRESFELSSVSDTTEVEYDMFTTKEKNKDGNTRLRHGWKCHCYRQETRRMLYAAP